MLKAKVASEDKNKGNKFVETDCISMGKILVNKTKYVYGINVNNPKVAAPVSRKS